MNKKRDIEDAINLVGQLAKNIEVKQTQQGEKTVLNSRKVMRRNKYAKFTVQFNERLKQGHSFEISYEEMRDLPPDKQFERILWGLGEAGVLIWREDVEE